MKPEEIISIFKEKNALLEGHFKLSSGLHSEKYLQCALILQYPDLAEKFAKALAEKFAKEKISVVVGPALGGITLAYEIGRALGARGIFTERQEGLPAPNAAGRAGRMRLRRSFSIKKGEKVLVAEDVVTTGLSTKEVIEVVKVSSGIVVGVASIIDRSGGKANFSVPFKSLAKIDIKTYKEQECPLCKKGIPVIKPGSRQI